MPAAAWPATVHRYSYVPFLVKWTLSFVDAPGLTSTLVVPAQALAKPPFELEQTLKSCGIVPLLMITNVVVPNGTDVFESVNLNSEVLPALTDSIVDTGVFVAGTAVFVIAEPAGESAYHAHGFVARVAVQNGPPKPLSPWPLICPGSLSFTNR